MFCQIYMKEIIWISEDQDFVHNTAQNLNK